jgi:hypothetical protein
VGGGGRWEGSVHHHRSQPRTLTHPPTHTAIYGLLVDPDYDSCLLHQSTPARRLDATPGAAAGAGATAAEIRAAKREAHKRRKEARRASKGLEHKLKKVKKVKKVGSLIVKAGTRKWRKEAKKKARLRAWQEKKRLRQQQKGPGGLAAVGAKGMLAVGGVGAGEGVGEEALGVRVGTIGEAAREGDKGFRVPGLRGVTRLSFRGAGRYARYARRATKQLLRVYQLQQKGKGGGGKQQQKGRQLVHWV